MHSQLRLAVLTALTALLASACGARTPVSSSEDGSVEVLDGARDGGVMRRDLGPGPVDFGPPPGCRGDTECSDGIACNGLERCAAGVCTSGDPPRCDDAIDCTDDVCVDLDRDLSECVSTPSSDRCGPGELCTPAGCAGLMCGSDGGCDDGFVCNGLEVCAGGICERGVPLSCDDGSICTTDRCVEGFGCRSTPRDDDGDGAVNSACGGTDCNDTNPRVRPGLGEVCDDVLDNDCSGRADCADPACAGRPPCGPPPPIDAGPFDLGPPLDFGMGTHEIGVLACTNGVDEDADGRADCADSDCRGLGPMGECCNGVDDTPGDDDPNYDMFACRCFSDADCVGVGSIETSCWTRSFSLCGPRCNFVGGNTFCRMFFGGMLERCDAVTGECVEP